MLQFKNAQLNVDQTIRTQFFNPTNYKHLLDIKLNELVNNITANESGIRVIPLPTETIPESYARIEQTDEYKDDNRALKDICTDFVTNIILNDEHSLFNFLYIITSLFQDALSVYKKKKGLRETDIFFVLKGGNVLRFVAKNFLFDISGGTADILLDFYKKFFKRSDADFSIIINPELDNYETIFDDISLLAYSLLKYIQSVFVTNKTRFFEWYKYDSKEKQRLLHNLSKELFELDLQDNDTWKDREITDISFENISAKELNNESYINPPDVAVRFEERYNYKTDSILWTIDNTNDEIYVSYNEALSFVKDRLIKFNLIRAKCGFTVHYNDETSNSNIISIGGELIDVSIGHRDDASVVKFYKTFHNNVSLFELELTENVSFEFRSYSIVYLFQDIYRILFVDVPYPWYDLKYVKRLNRLFYIGYIDLFMKFIDNKERLEYLNLLLEVVLSIEKIIQHEQGSDIKNENIRESINLIKKQMENSDLVFDMFLNKTLKLLLDEIDESELKYDDRDNRDDRDDRDNRDDRDDRDELAPYNVDKSSTTDKIHTNTSKHIESTSSIAEERDSKRSSALKSYTSTK